MAIDTAFFKHLEDVFPGRDIRAHNDEKLHNHGTSTITHGRGSVLTVDLTNRCNMMCDPCFMDANQVGFVHELTLGRHQDAARQRHHHQAASARCRCSSPAASRRISPYFLDAVRYARKVGYNSVQAATNGIEFAKSPEFCQQGGRSRPALRLPAVRRHRQRRQLAPQGRQPVRREAARHREPAQPTASTSSRSSRSSTASTTSRSAASSSSRSTTPRRSRSSRSSRCRSPAATRKSPTSAAPRSATRCRTWRTT